MKTFRSRDSVFIGAMGFGLFLFLGLSFASIGRSPTVVRAGDIAASASVAPARAGEAQALDPVAAVCSERRS